MTDDSQLAILGASSSVRSMADGTLRIAIDIMPADAVAAFTAFGVPGSAVVLARITNAAAIEAGLPGADTELPAMYGSEARELKLSGFFRTPDVWAAVGTDKAYLYWVKRQPSARSGNFSEWHDDGEKFCVPAHYRKVAHGAGTAIKPEYCAIPLTDIEHKQTHDKGDSYIGDEEWWEKKRIKYVQNWAWVSLKEQLGYESWSRVPPRDLAEWATTAGVFRYLPNVYKDTVAPF